jgi:hypothetical protein
VKETEVKRFSHVTVTPPDVDTDTEKEEDVERIDNSPPNPLEWQPGESIGSPLSAAFETSSGIPMHSPPRWCETITEMERLGLDANDIKIAVSELRGKNYNIIGPWSVMNAALNVHGKRNGNGSRRRRKIEE